MELGSLKRKNYTMAKIVWSTCISEF